MTATEDKSYYIARTKLAEYLDNRRLRKTPERFAILEAVFSHNDHFGIEALYVDMENARITSADPLSTTQWSFLRSVDWCASISSAPIRLCMRRW